MNPARVTGVTTAYPSFGARYEIDASSVSEPETEPVAFEDLARESRIEVANGITRAWCLSSPPAFHDSEHYGAPIRYRGSTFSVRVDDRQPLGYPPRRGPDWRAPLGFDGRVEDRALTVTATNELDAPLDVNHYGPPYFGVLTAVGDEPVLLPHNGYDPNPFIDTSGVVRAYPASAIDSHNGYRTETLAPGESLRETYLLPEALPPTSTVRLSVPMFDPTPEVLGDWRVLAVARLDIESPPTEG